MEDTPEDRTTVDIGCAPTGITGGIGCLLVAIAFAIVCWVLGGFPKFW